MAVQTILARKLVGGKTVFVVVKLLKFFLAFSLLPALGSTVHFGIRLVADAAVLETWSRANAACFIAGMVVWIIVFLTLPKPTRLYILGHELTHAIFVWLSGGKVSGLKIGAKKGQIVASKNSALISLAPYIFPFYPVLLGLGWLLVSWFWPEIRSGLPFFLFFWGAAWSFHLCFTLSVMRTEQTDFSSQGYLFSFVTIFLCNAWILIVLLWLALRIYPFGEGLLIFWHILVGDYGRIGNWLVSLAKG